MIFPCVVLQPIAVELDVLQGAGEFLGPLLGTNVITLSEMQHGHRSHVTTAGEQQAQAVGVVSPDPVERPPGFLAAIVKVGWVVAIIGCPRIERMRNQVVHAAHLVPVGQPFHRRIGQVLVVTTKNLAERNVVILVVRVRNRTGNLGHLVFVHVAIAWLKLATNQINAAHVAVLLQLHHVSARHLPVENFVAVLHEVAHRDDLVLAAPATHAAIHRATPRLREAVEITIKRGRLVIAGEFELVGD